MKRRHSKSLSALGVLLTTALFGLFAGCSTEFGEACELPSSPEIDSACEDEDNRSFCLWQQSDECDSQLCGTYLTSNGFCTQTCDPEVEESCPSSAFCQPFGGIESGGFCVPNSVANSDS